MFVNRNVSMSAFRNSEVTYRKEEKSGKNEKV